jgi:2-polyprenyl-3-methyl-5-hydroxy-6-metoxy-1,4-benzoquinol methylase
MNCPVCDITNVTPVYYLFDDRYGYPAEFVLVRCEQCGHHFLEHDLTPEDLTMLYTNYYPRSELKLEEYKPYSEIHGFKTWLNGEKSSPFRWVPPCVKVLDIGCGFGETIGYYQARGCEAHGVEADENIRRIIEKYGYKIEVGLFDAKKYELNYFDYITMEQVVEHLVDPVDALRGITDILKPGGRLIISTPNANGWGRRVFGRKWINWHAPYHVQMFSVKSMMLAAEQAGLTVERYTTITHSEWLYYQLIHLALYPEKGIPSVFWAPKAQGDEKNSKQQAMLAWVSLLRKYHINQIITRLFDCVGSGDNYLFFLQKPL